VSAAVVAVKIVGLPIVGNEEVKTAIVVKV